ncbi:MAG: MBL fold metallo-hydrolase [Synergistaceae bacterium]|nr:MBL fold metallo-hydrolase [Synergistaceae bacterium]
MRLRILGAAGEVTGSNYMIETKNYKVLVDCGFHQGQDEEKHEGELFSYNPADIDAVLLTHAHIDHSGRIPLLVKMGFKGKIYCTYATTELVKILWKDSSNILRETAEWKSKKNLRKGLNKVEPLFGDKEVETTLELRSPVPYDEVLDIMPGLKVRFREAGHILGSAIIETWISEDEGQKARKVVFSGDLGSRDGVIEKPMAFIEEADFVLIESTYGDRLHKSLEDTRFEFQNVLKYAAKNGSKILIPTFMVDRAQRLLYELTLFQKSFPEVELPSIYLDSPMGVKTTEIYSKYINLLSRDLKKMLVKGEDPFEPENFTFVRTPDESRELNKQNSAIILAGSGMCSGGRIIHHLKHSLFKSDTQVIFVGYQAFGTLGRKLVDGLKKVRIMGEDIIVKATMNTIGGFSAHADKDDLLKWASGFPKKAQFLVVHGEPKSSDSLASSLKELGYSAWVPTMGEEIDLLIEKPHRDESWSKAASAKEEARKAFVEMEEALEEVKDLAENVDPNTINDSDYAKVIPLLKSVKALFKIITSSANKK